MSTVAPVASSADATKFTAEETSRLLLRQLNPLAVATAISSLRGTQELCSEVTFDSEERGELDALIPSLPSSPYFTTVDFSMEEGQAYMKKFRSTCAENNGDVYLLTFWYNCYAEITTGEIVSPSHSLFGKRVKDIPICTSNCPDAEAIEDEYDMAAKAYDSIWCNDSIVDVKADSSSSAPSVAPSVAVDKENTGTMLSVCKSLAVVSIVSSVAALLFM